MFVSWMCRKNKLSLFRFFELRKLKNEGLWVKIFCHVPTAGQQNKIVPFLSSAKGGSINKNRVVVTAIFLSRPKNGSK